MAKEEETLFSRVGFNNHKINYILITTLTKGTVFIGRKSQPNSKKTLKQNRKKINIRIETPNLTRILSDSH